MNRSLDLKNFEPKGNKLPKASVVSYEFTHEFARLETENEQKNLTHPSARRRGEIVEESEESEEEDEEENMQSPSSTRQSGFSASRQWNPNLAPVKEIVEESAAHSPNYSPPTEREVEKAIANLFGRDLDIGMEKRQPPSAVAKVFGGCCSNFAPSPDHPISAGKSLGKEIATGESFHSSSHSSQLPLLREESGRSRESAHSEIVAEEGSLQKSASLAREFGQLSWEEGTKQSF